MTQSSTYSPARLWYERGAVQIEMDGARATAPTLADAMKLVDEREGEQWLTTTPRNARTVAARWNGRGVFTAN